MKKLSWSMILLVGILAFGCKKDDDASKDVLFNKFKETGKCWESETEINSLLKQGTVGYSPETALVPLLFDQEGNLFTGEEYNSLFESGQLATSVARSAATTLDVFRAVTGMQFATEDYANIIDNRWFFDPYQTSYEVTSALATSKSASMVQESSILKSTSVPTWARAGNILCARWDSLMVWGYPSFHTGGIIKSSLPTNSYSEAMRTSMVAEALVGTGVTKRTMSSGTDFWNDPRILERMALVLPGLNGTQAQKIIDFQSNVGGREYLLYSTIADDKKREMYFYVSKLQWLAYYKAGIDIDRNGGKFVFPTDIVENPIFDRIAF